MTPPVYAKRWGIFRNPAVRQELKKLDPTCDYQRMVQLLVGYEFPFDITRALELALFHTFASPSVSALLARTGQFERHGQKRYDDTSLLISQFMQDGLESETGQRAIAQMNRIHGHYTIPNEDFIFVLSTFVFYPINWVNSFGWRKLTTGEEQALFLFFWEVGKRMHMQQVPETMEALQAFTATYEARHFQFTESNRKIADATVRIVEGWFPFFLRFAVKPVFSALINDSLRKAFGYQRPGSWFIGLLNGSFWLRKFPLRWITFEAYPTLIENTTYRSYPSGPPVIEGVGPEGLESRKGNIR
jgi:hypothetical protein